MSATEFSTAMRVTVPKKIHAGGRRYFLIVATRVDEELTRGVHVDTGYLRASKAAATQGVAFPTLPPKPTKKRAMQFAVLWPRSQAQAASAIAQAVKRLAPLRFAFGASYARYEKTGTPALIRRVKAMLPRIQREAATRVQRTLSSSEAAD